jgi:capsular exopolysaccharide synthesis family protein
VRILDSAEPPTKPVRGESVTLILLGLLIGLGSGIAIAFLIDRFDPRFRYPDQVSKGLGLPILGTIPEIKRAKGQNASQDEAAQVVEAFRSIRMSLAHSFDPAGPIVLTISSPGPGDGKSLIASNLALSFAEAGYRTVLLDGDIRRGSLHHTFGVERRPGLVDHLAGDASLAAILRPATHALLTLIPCGSRRHLGPELLGSARMRELMTHLTSTYQVVIVDTPPLGAGIDPFVLSTATGHLAIVLRAGETDRQMAEAKLQILDRLPVRLLGAILNDVRLKEGAYKYYRYSYGYVADVEEEDTVQLESGAKPG